MEKINLISVYDTLQKKYGDKNLNSVYGGGCIKSPKVCFVFMNPTAKNIATAKSWKGVRYQWLGTKPIWKFFNKLGLISDELNNEIQNKKAADWTNKFCIEVYNEVKNNRFYITNLAKCTQADARHLSDSVFLEYKKYLLLELEQVNPKKIVFFGNQVSSIMLNQNISVSNCRNQKFNLEINNKNFDCYAVYYPVGNGFFNVDKAIEDLNKILK